MAEEKHKKHNNADRHQTRGKKRHAPRPAPLTPEQQAAVKAAAEKAAADAKVEQERLQNWEKNVEKMSTPQLKSEVKRLLKTQHVRVGKGQYEAIPGLTIAFATVFDTVLERTKVVFDRNDRPQLNGGPFAKLAHYVR